MNKPILTHITNPKNFKPMVTTFNQVKQIVKENPFFILSFTGENVSNYSQEICLEDCQDLSAELGDYQYGYLYLYGTKEELIKEIMRELRNLDLTEGSDDTYFDYNPDTYQGIITASILVDTWESVKPEIESKLKAYQEWLEAAEEYFEPIEEYNDINIAIDNAHHLLETLLG